MNSKVMNKVLSFLLVAAVAFTTIFTPVNAATVNSRDKKLKGKIKSMTVMNGALEIQNKDIVPLPVGGTLNLTVDFVDKSEKKAASHEVVVKSSNKKALTADKGYDKELNESAPVLTLTENAKVGDKYNVTIKSKAKKVKTVKFAVEVIDQVPVTGVTLDNTAPKVGDTINAKLAPENATNVVSYAWQADNTPILGATTASYVVGEADLGKKIKVVITDTEGKTFESAESEAVKTDKEIAVTGVSLSETAPKVGQTIEAVLAPAGANNVASYQWYADGVAINEATGSTYIVAKTDIDKKLKVVVTDNAAKTFESAESVAVIEDLSAGITLSDDNGLQLDGTALPTDTLSISYGAALGTPKYITWYRSGAVVKIASLDGNGIGAGAMVLSNASGLKAGEYYVIIENTAGELYTSNSIIVTEEGQGVVSGFSIEDDYGKADGANLDYDANDSYAVVTVKLNKDYNGTFYIYKADQKKYNNKTDASANGAVAKLVLTTGNTATTDTANKTTVSVKTKDKQMTAENAVNLSKAGAATATLGSTLKYVDSNTGEVTYMFVPEKGANAAFATNEANLARGTSYVIAFDQEDIESDNIKTDDRDDIVVSEAFAVPYITAPASIAVTAYKTGTTTPEIEVYGEDGNKLAFLTMAAAANLGTKGFQSFDFFAKTTNKIEDGDAKKAATGGTAYVAKEGKVTITLDAATGTTEIFSYAKAKTTKGVYAKDAIELVSEICESASDPMSGLTLSQDKDDPTAAKVEFSGLKSKAPGKVYIMVADKATTTAPADFLALNTDDALGSADVAGATKEIVIPGVFDQKQIDDAAVSAANAYKATFMAVFVPEDLELWNKMANGYHNTATDTDVAFKLESKATTYAIGGVAKAQSADKKTTLDGTETQSNATLITKNQFGNEMLTDAVTYGNAVTFTLVGVSGSSVDAKVKAYWAGNGTIGDGNSKMTIVITDATNANNVKKDDVYYYKVDPKNYIVLKATGDNSGKFDVSVSDTQPS